MKKTLLLVAVFATSFITTFNAQSALDFDGVDDYVDLGSSFNVVSYTKEFWVKWDGVSTANNVLSGNDFNPHVFWFPDAQGNKMTAGNAGNFNEIQDPNPVVANVWTHFALTYDSFNGDMYMYRDGVQVAYYDGPDGVGFTTTTLLIGAYDNDSENPNTAIFTMGGQIDDVRVWDYVRSQTEISTGMNLCLTGSETGLVAYYGFEDGTGSTTLADGTSNGYDGTLTNMDPASDWVLGQGFCGTLSSPGFEQELGLSVFPNPTSNIINIKSTSNIDKVEMFNLLGKKVLSVTGTERFKINHLPIGVYVLNAYSEKGKVIKKVIIE